MCDKGKKLTQRRKEHKENPKKSSFTSLSFFAFFAPLREALFETVSIYMGIIWNARSAHERNFYDSSPCRHRSLCSAVVRTVRTRSRSRSVSAGRHRKRCEYQCPSDPRFGPHQEKRAGSGTRSAARQRSSARRIEGSRLPTWTAFSWPRPAARTRIAAW
jgi:hypothetical protein